MLKRIAILVVLLAAPALAQQAPPVDPVVVAYSQLLNEANSRVAVLSAQVNQLSQVKATLEGRIGQLEKDNEALKGKAAPAAAATPAPDGK